MNNLTKLLPSLFVVLAVCFGFKRDTIPPSVLTPVADKNMATVEQIKGVYVFMDSKPVRPYKYLGNVKGKSLSLNPQYTNIRDGILKRLANDYPQADGVILHLNSGGFDFGDAIKFE